MGYLGIVLQAAVSEVQLLSWPVFDTYIGQSKVHHSASTHAMAHCTDFRYIIGLHEGVYIRCHAERVVCAGMWTVAMIA